MEESREENLVKQKENFFNETAAIYSNYFDLNRKSGTTFNFNRRLQLMAILAGSCSGSMLDCATGDGTITACVLQSGNFHTATLIDLSANMLKLTQEVCNPIAQAKDLNLDYRNIDIFELLDSESCQETYDLIICSGLIAHINDAEKLLKLLGRRLSTSGKIILQTTLLDSIITQFIRALTKETFFRRNGYYINYYNNQDIESLCKSSDLKIDSVEKFSIGMQFLDRFLPAVWNYNIESQSVGLAKVIGSEALYFLSRLS